MLADIFVYLDHVPFSKGSYTNRAKFGIEDRTFNLTIPVKARPSGQPINALRAARTTWIADHQNKLQNWCKHHAYYKDIEFVLEVLGEVRTSILAEINIHLITAIRNALDIDVNVVNSSTVEWNVHSTELIRDIIVKLEGNCYLSGIGFKNYYNVDHWDKNLDLHLVDFGELIAQKSCLQPDSIVSNIAKLGIGAVKDELAAVADYIKSTYPVI